MKKTLFIAAVMVMLTGGLLYAMPGNMLGGGSNWGNGGDQYNTHYGSWKYDDQGGYGIHENYDGSHEHGDHETPSDQSTVPEPTTVALLALGALAMGGYRRLRR